MDLQCPSEITSYTIFLCNITMSMPFPYNSSQQQHSITINYNYSISIGINVFSFLGNFYQFSSSIPNAGYFQIIVTENIFNSSVSKVIYVTSPRMKFFYSLIILICN